MQVQVHTYHTYPVVIISLVFGQKMSTLKSRKVMLEDPERL